MKGDNGGPAFPNVPDGAGDKWADWDEGMTMRDYFAAKAMSGDWAAQDIEGIGAFPCDIDEETLIKRAQIYYRMADAMLKARGE
ncbi:hypothetical protein ACM55O_22170 [Hafnia paralvei]|uniref:hypothetical protein n=1 Tax=Hafnia paralvei TaxID=546367 RepID=UPI0039FD7B6D